MEFRDFIGLSTALMATGLPLAAVYSVLKRTGWNSRKGVMSDAMVIWITWLLSSLGTIVFLLLVDPGFASSGGLQAILFPAITAWAIGTMAIFITMKSLSSFCTANAIDVVSRNDLPDASFRSRDVFLISFAATAAFAIGSTAGWLINTGYTYFNPPPANPFGIYDI